MLVVEVWGVIYNKILPLTPFPDVPNNSILSVTIYTYLCITLPEQEPLRSKFRDLYHKDIIKEVDCRGQNKKVMPNVLCNASVNSYFIRNLNGVFLTE